jgi:hypothetical protein
MTISRLMVTILTVVALAIVPSLYGQAGQADPQSKQGQQADRPGGGDASVTGCLTEAGGSYILATSSGDQVSVSGSADLAKHKDHTVKLTGKASDEGGKKSITVSKIEMVSASCSK